MARFKDTEWNLPTTLAGGIGSVDGGAAHLAVLMDIRDEMKRLNALLSCPNFTGIPQTLKSIHRAMPAKSPRRKAKKR